MMPWLTAIPGAFKLVPKWVWYALAAALAWHFALAWHHGQVKAHDVRVVAARDAQWQARFDAMHKQAEAFRAASEDRGRTIADLQRKLNNEENHRIAADADDLRLRGPGQAAAAAGCRPVDHSRLAAAAGRRDAAGRPGADAAAAVPAADRRPDFALVPWGWLVDVVEQADSNRAESLTWREADKQQREAWERLRSQAPGAPAKPGTGTKGTADARQ